MQQLLAICVVVCSACPLLAQDEFRDSLNATRRREFRRSPIVEAFADTHGAVVNIAATKLVPARRSMFDALFYDFDEFMGRRRHQELSSVGSGFVIHKDGYIVTNAHVIDRTVGTKVIFDDDRTFDAEIVASDPQHDLALIKIDAPIDLQVVRFGRSDDLMIGETVIAIGNPLGYQHTVTSGIISATSRDLTLYSKQARQEVLYENLIQTDAGINPGSSGGPLLNVLGELIGITTAIRADAQNIGFAIPVQTLESMLPAMLASVQISRFFFGADVNRDRAVTEVATGSPAERGGVRPGDRISTINGETVGSLIDYYLALIDHQPGDRLELTLNRDGRALSARAMLQAPPRADGLQLAQKRLGITLAQMDRETAGRYGMWRRGGLIITEIEPRGPAASVGVKAGDVLTVLDRYYVSNLEEVGQVLADSLPSQRMYIRILRPAGRKLYRDESRVTLR